MQCRNCPSIFPLFYPPCRSMYWSPDVTWGISSAVIQSITTTNLYQPIHQHYQPIHHAWMQIIWFTQVDLILFIWGIHYLSNAESDTHCQNTAESIQTPLEMERKPYRNVKISALTSNHKTTWKTECCDKLASGFTLLLLSDTSDIYEYGPLKQLLLLQLAPW